MKIRITFYIIFLLLGLSHSAYSLSDKIESTGSKPMALTLDSIVTTDVTTCYGGNDGTITVYVSGGTTSYQYSIDGGVTYQGSNSFVGLTSGVYSVYVKDFFNVVVSDVAYIDEPSEIIINNEVHTNVTGCYGDSNGTISITASGGTGTLQYSIDNGANYYTNGGNFVGVSGGTYQVWVRDSNLCPKAGSDIIVTQPLELVITAENKTDVTGCHGDNNGIIDITTTGGTPTIKYSIDGGTSYGTGHFFPSLIPGNYQVMAQDANGCTTVGSNLTITEPPAVTINSETFTDVNTCFGDHTGIITINASGGTGTLYYSIDGETNYFANGGNFNNLYAGTYITVVKDDNLCTVFGDTVNVGQPPQIVIDSETKSDVSTCFGDSTGQITITAHGGIAPLEYSVNSGTTFQASNLFNNLPSNSYSTVVKDFNNCMVTGQDHLIEQPTLLLINDVNTTNVSTCFGGNDGTIHIVTNGGGTTAYNFSVDGGSNYFPTNDFLNLTAGIYDVIVRDAHSCTDTFKTRVVEIGEPAQLVINSEIESEPKCFGDSTGSITVNATGGTGQITYSPDNGTHFFTNNILSGLSSGPTYQIVVKDAHGCTTVGGSHILGQPAELIIDSVVGVNVNDCNGGTNGSITIFAHGGTLPLEFSDDGEVTYQASNIFSGLSAGNYQTLVKDANKCKQVGDLVHITQPDILQVSYQSKKDILGCHGDLIGEIHIDYLGGTAPVQYSIDGGTTYFSNNGDFTGLAAGNYDIVIRDTNNCPANGNPVTINEPEELIPSLVEKQDVKCYGDATGYINLTATGGQAPHYFSINNGVTYSSGSFFNGLIAGSYQTYVKDIYDCVKPGPLVIINEPDTLSIDSVTVQNINGCYGDNDGQITIHASGGVVNYMYSINQGDSYYDNGGTFSNLSPGTYYIKLYDANLCPASWLDNSLNWDTVRITQPSRVQITDIETTDILCYGNNNGIITITANGGTGALHYSIDDGTTFPDITGTFNNLPAGDYFVKVRDDNNCMSSSYPKSIYEPDSLIITSVVAEDEQCVGSDDGTITVNTSGGTYPFEFSIDGIIWQSDKTIGNLSPGTYTSYVRDANSCPATGNPVTIGSPQDASLFDVSDSIGCSPLIVQFTRTTPGSTYLWDFGDGETVTQNEPNHTFINTTLNPVDYTVTAYSVSPNNCLDTAERIITVYPRPQLNFTANPLTAYFPQSEITITNNSPGGYTNYNWDFGDGGTSSDENPGSHTYDDCGSYDIELSANNTWCSDTVKQTVTITAMQPEAIFSVDTSQSCVPVTINFENQSMYIDTFEWDMGDGTIIYDNNFSYTYTTPGEYIVTLNTTGYCNTFDSRDTTIYVFQSPIVNFEVMPDTVMLPNQPIHCNNLSSDDADLFYWEFGDGGNSEDENPIYYYSAPGTYDITLTVTSVNKCVDSLTLTSQVIVLPEGKVIFPSAFSPNGNGINDIFGPAEYSSVKSFEMYIYNRWGEKMFYTNDITKGWNGYFNGISAMQDVYVWRADGFFLNGTPFELAGSVTLLR
ncbi:MAG: PKD domain-containing protein [Chlorobi bacterium]|nr:PKD domain-containing protein [Chlorobiota bacterium]